MSEQRVEVESSGETVGEARWAALHELERRFPALDRGAVEFVVLSEGERGLLGVGYEPARVLAAVLVDPEAAAPPPAALSPAEITVAPDDGPAAARVRQLVERVVHGLGIEGSVDLREADGVVTATVHGRELGLLIGKHGQTIDAIQYLANAIQHRREQEPVEVVVDAEGYPAARANAARCGCTGCRRGASHRRGGGARADDLGGTEDRARQGAIAGRPHPPPARERSPTATWSFGPRCKT